MGVKLVGLRKYEEIVYNYMVHVKTLICAE